MTGRLSRADLDGTDVDLVKALTSTPHGLTIDTVNRKLYLTNGWGKVQRMNLNGSKFEPNLIVNLDAPRGVAIDAAARKIYWTERRTRSARANFNGRSIQTVASGLGSPVNIVLDGLLPEPATRGSAKRCRGTCRGGCYSESDGTACQLSEPVQSRDVDPVSVGCRG